MDLVETGRERRPLHPAFLVVAAVAVTALAAVGTLRAMDAPVRRPVAAPPSPVETSTSIEPVSYGGAVTAPPVAPGEGLDLLLVGGGTVTALRTTNGAEETVTTFPDGPVEKFVPLRDGFAALVGGTLVVRHPDGEARIRLGTGALVEGGTDAEFWTLGAGTAQRYDDRGRKVGSQVRLPEGLSVVRGVVGGLLAHPEEHSMQLRVWDPATRRVVHEVGELGPVVATGYRHVLTGGECWDGGCPLRRTDVVNGVTTTTQLPAGPGTLDDAVLGAGQEFAFVWPSGISHDLYLGTGGGAAPRLLTRGLPHNVHLAWAAPHRLAILQVTDGRLVVSVWDTRKNELRQAGAFAARDLELFAARPAS